MPPSPAESTSVLHELRILSGLHAGARAPIADGECIGAQTDCDIMLSDPGLPGTPARCHLSTTGWQLDAGDTQALNKALRFGPIWLCVARPDDPWIEIPITLEPNALAEADGRNDPRSPDPAPQPASAPAPGSDPAGRKTPPRTASSVTNLASIVLSRRLILSVVALLIALSVLLLVNRSPATPQPASASATRGLSAQASLIPIRAAIQTLNLRQIQASAGDQDTQARITGWVHDDAELNALSEAMARIWPMPALKVRIETRITAAIEQALAAHPLRYRAIYLGDGRLRVDGVAPDAQSRSAVLAQLNEQWPDIPFDQSRIELATEITRALEELLRQHGLDSVRPVWSEARLYADGGRLGEAGRRQLREIIRTFNQAHADIAVPHAPGTSDAVPFGIRSVVGGAQPYLVLSDGSKLLTGGSVEGYRLESVDPGRVIFGSEQAEGEHAASTTITR